MYSYVLNDDTYISDFLENVLYILLVIYLTLKT